MLRTSNLILPYDPASRAHWEEDQRRSETRKWLDQQKRLRVRQDSPSVIPDADAASKHRRVKSH
jgi:hypothetical protein